MGKLRHATLKIICFLAYLAVACAVSTLAVGQEATLEQARDHIITMFRAERDLNAVTIRKWTMPIRYMLIGADDRAKKAFADEAASLSLVTGLEITQYEEGSEQQPNVYYVFTRDLAETAKSPLIRSAFKNADETDQEYDDRTSKFAEQPMHEKLYWGDTSIGLYVFMLDPSRMSFDVQTQMLRLFFTTLVPIYTSDVIQPSIVNQSPSVHELAASDTRFLRAVYSKEIRFGMKLTDALPILEAAIARSDQ